jgi:hypothetical protein
MQADLGALTMEPCGVQADFIGPTRGIALGAMELETRTRSFAARTRTLKTLT